jgi:hypothetical protein
MSVTAAALRAAGAASTAAAASSAGLPLPLLQQLLAMLVLLLEVAPNARLRRQLLQLQLHAVVLRQLQDVVAKTCCLVAEDSSAGCAAEVVCRQLMEHFMAAAGQQR